MEGTGLKLILAAVRCLLGPIGMSGLWLALRGLIANPNSPNRGYNPPPFAYSSQLATPLPPTLSPPCDII